MSRLAAAAATGLPTFHHDALGCSRALAAAVAAASRAAEEHLDAELLDLGGRWLTVRRELAALYAEQELLPRMATSDATACAMRRDVEQRLDEANQRETWLEEAILVLRAHSFAGLTVKVRVLAVADDCPHHDDAEMLAWAATSRKGQCFPDPAIRSLVRDLLRLAQESPK